MILAQAAEQLTREQAQEAARRELSRSDYDTARPALLLRLVGRALSWLGSLVDGAAGSLGHGGFAQVLLLVVVVVVVGVALVRLGPLGGRPPAAARGFEGPRRTATEHRDLATALAAEGRFAEAVRERLRAVVRELEGRGLLDARPGRTATEVARDAAAAAPVLADDLHRAAVVFDEVWYGGRPATASSYSVLVALDERLATARLVGA